MADEPNKDDRGKPRSIRACSRSWFARAPRPRCIYDEARQELISRAASLAYPIRDGIPIMLEEEARQLDDEELRALTRR